MHQPIHLITYFILFIVALLAGFLGAIAGGGGLLTLPAILAIGLPPQIALGTNKMLATFTTFSSTFVFFKKKIFRPSLWIPAIVTTIFSATLGVITVQYLSPKLLSKILPIVIIFSATYSVCSSPKSKKSDIKNRDSESFKPDVSSSIFISGILGFYGSFAGVGLGLFWTSTLQFFYKLKVLNSSGIARGMCFISNTTSFIGFMYFGHINYLIGGTMGIMMAIGAYMGAHSAIMLGDKFVKLTIVFISIGSTFYLLVKVWF